jgi:membrane-associated phospholipid phosphatase
MTAHEIRDEIGADRPVDARHTATPGRPASSLGWAALAAGGLGAFALLTWIVASRLTLGFDQPLLDAAHGVSQYQALWQGLSDVANLPLIAIGIGLVLTLLVRREAREAGLVVLVLAAVTAGSEAVKELVARPRPPGFGTSIPGVVYSYPSGHVLEALTIFGMICILMWRSTLPWTARVAVPLLSALAVVLVAVARVAVNAHYPSDVLAGLAGGLGCLGLFGWGTQAITRRRTAGPGVAA